LRYPYYIHHTNRINPNRDKLVLQRKRKKINDSTRRQIGCKIHSVNPLPIIESLRFNTIQNVLNKMKLTYLFLLTLFIQNLTAQSIYPYEQKIIPTKDLIFEEISFVNPEDNIQLSGTLIYPKDGYQKIIMIVPGSGRDTRLSHFQLVESFLQNKIAVYRFDERGIGESEGKYDYTATTLMNDVVCAYRALRYKSDLAEKQIGILGHSLGGIASVGAFGKGCDFDFLIQMGTPVKNKGAFIKFQATTNTDGFYTVKNKSTEEVIQFIDALSKVVLPEDDFKATKKKAKVLMKRMDMRKGGHIVNPLIIDLTQQDYEKSYQTSTVPILFIIGSEDRIVSSENEPLALKRLNNPKIDVKIIPNVNHWLSDKLAPTQMDKSLYDMNKQAKDAIVNWTLLQ